MSVPFARVFATVALLAATASAQQPKPDPLPEGAVRRLGTTDFRVGGSATVRGFALSPDGKQAALVTERHIQVWDVATGRPVASVPRPSARFERVAGGDEYTNGRLTWAVDGKSLLIPFQGHILRCLVPLKDEFTKLPIAEERIGFESATSTEPGDTVFGLSASGLLLRYLPRMGEWAQTGTDPVKRDRDRGNNRHLASGKGVVAVAGSDGNVQVWDPVKRESPGPLEIGGPVNGLAVSADGTRLAVLIGGVRRDGIQVWSVPDRKRVAAWPRAFHRAVALSADGTLLAAAVTTAVGPTANVVEVFEAATGKKLHALPVGEDAISFLAFRPGGSELLAAGTEGVIHRWDAKTGKRVDPDDGHRGGVRAVIALADGRVLTGGADGDIRLWDGAGKEVRRFVGHTRAVAAFAVSADGKTLFSGGTDHTLRAWDVADGKQLRAAELDLVQDGEGAWALALSADGKTLAAALWSGVRLYDPATLAKRDDLVPVGEGKPGSKKPPPERPLAVAFAANGRLVTLNLRRTLRVWDVEKKEVAVTTDLKKLEHLVVNPRQTEFLAVSPDGKTAAVPFYPTEELAGRQSFLTLWDIASGKEVRRIPVGEKTRLSAVAFTPDGKSAVVGDDWNGRVWLVDLEGKKVTKTLDAGRHNVWSLSVAPDGKTFVTGGSDTTALVWKLDAK